MKPTTLPTESLCPQLLLKYSQEIYQKLEANEIEFVSQVAPQRFIKFLKKSTVTCVHNVDKNFEGTIVNDNYHCAF